MTDKPARERFQTRQFNILRALDDPSKPFECFSAAQRNFRRLTGTIAQKRDLVRGNRRQKSDSQQTLWPKRPAPLMRTRLRSELLIRACSKTASTLVRTFTASTFPTTRAGDVNPTLTERQKNGFAFGSKDLPCLGKQRDLDQAGSFLKHGLDHTHCQLSRAGRIGSIPISTDLISVSLSNRRSTDNDLDLLTKAGFLETFYNLRHVHHRGCQQRRHAENVRPVFLDSVDESISRHFHPQIDHF